MTAMQDVEHVRFVIHECSWLSCLRINMLPVFLTFNGDQVSDELSEGDDLCTLSQINRRRLN